MASDYSCKTNYCEFFLNFQDVKVVRKNLSEEKYFRNEIKLETSFENGMLIGRDKIKRMTDYTADTA